MSAFFFQEKISGNFKSITFFPDKFNDYLLSDEVGFASCELMGTPTNKSKGFFCFHT
jgi:7SK snRNA methylphosphate capping enzyme